MTIPLSVDLSKAKSLLPDSSILAGFRGSISHGTYREETGDIDLLSVHIAPPEHYLGFGRRGQETIEIMEGDYDIVSHELVKFCDLLANGNPNVASLLNLPHHFVVHQTTDGQRLRFNWDYFLSKRFFYSFRGYAQSMRERLNKQKFEGFKAENREEEAQTLGYNPKAACELVRLLDQGIELLNSGSYNLPRPNADYLLEIKEGNVPLEDVLEHGTELEQILEETYEQSHLPEKSERDKIEQIIMEILRKHV